MLDAGTILGTKYRLDAEIGRGGMGSVWRATRLDLGTELAIKVMTGESLNKPGGLERFTREAKAAASLTSPHVVRIIDFGADLEGSVAFMAMELLEGESLASRLSARKALPPQRVASFITQVARALSQAHAAGIVHRDLKPANIFLVHNADDEMVKLLDFGIAKAGDGLSTATGSMLGTPYYMSPEQVNCAKDIDHRTDLWSLGVIACECMTGQRPFAAETLSELAMKIALGRAEIPSSLAAVPAGFDAWFARATHVDRQQRFQSATELASALAGIVTTAPAVSVTPVAELELAATLPSSDASGAGSAPAALPPTGVTTDSKLATTSAGTTVPSRPGARRSPRAWRAGALLAAAAAISGGVYFGAFSSPEGASSGAAAAAGAPPAEQRAPTTSAAVTPPSGAGETAPAHEAPAPSPASGQAGPAPVAPAKVAAEAVATEAVATEKAPPAPAVAERAAAGGAARPQAIKSPNRATAARKTTDTRARPGRPESLTAPADALDAYDLQ